MKKKKSIKKANVLIGIIIAIIVIAGTIYAALRSMNSMVNTVPEGEVFPSGVINPEEGVPFPPEDFMNQSLQE